MQATESGHPNRPSPLRPQPQNPNVTAPNKKTPDYIFFFFSPFKSFLCDSLPATSLQLQHQCNDK
jgi:hypothetical protein